MLRPMSRERTRPTREDTRQRLLRAAVSVFKSDGIGGASIEGICEAAKLTRGAFYSNFTDKNDNADPNKHQAPDSDLRIIPTQSCNL